MIQKVENFPRSFRFTVGDRLTHAVIDLTLKLVDAAYSRDRARILGEVNVILNHLRVLLRLAKDLKILPAESWGFAAEKVEEIGRMAGGWRKAAAQ